MLYHRGAKKNRAVHIKFKKHKGLWHKICLYTGLRIGELLALEWSNIDFKKEELHVCKTCYDGKDKQGKFTRLIDMPKTASSNRIILIPKQLIAILKKMRKDYRNRCIR